MEAALAYLGTGTAAVEVGASAGLASAGISATTGWVGTAATSGLWGTAGQFSLGTTLSTLGTGLSAFGTLGAGIAGQRTAEYNAKLAEQNAVLAIADAERSAFYLKRNAENEAAQLRAKQRRAQSSRAAIVGASGLDMSGSPAAVLQGADYLGELDIQTILQGGQIAADNALLRGSRAATAQAALDTTRAQSELTGGLLGAGTTLLRYGAKRTGFRSDSLSDYLM